MWSHKMLIKVYGSILKTTTNEIYPYFENFSKLKHVHISVVIYNIYA